MTPDLPGHGANGDRALTLIETADAIAQSLPAPVDLGGYSLGARVALHLALRHPEKVRSLTLLGVSLGIESPEGRAARRQRDEDLARRLEVQGPAEFLVHWLAQPLFSGPALDPAERDRRLENSAAGLASSLRLSGTGTQEWLAPQLAMLTMPTLALAGVRDLRFLVHAQRIADLAPHARFALVPGANHPAHLHQPVLTAGLVQRFLSARN